jgi:hypothetical protein
MTELPEYCENSSQEQGGLKCKARAVHGHIYCKPCRLANGGFDRYNTPAKSHTHHTPQE